MTYHKILILGSLPYKQNAQSRAFDSYFHYWPKEKLHQFFSSPYPPCKGHCSQFYQITDYQILKRNFNSRIKVGRIFYDAELANFKDEEILDNTASKLYKSGKHKTALKRLLRKFIWKKRYWCTEEFVKWIEDFRPEVIFLAWSDDFYMLNIAKFICKKFNLPLISCVGDDYYFNTHFSFSPFYWIYRFKYKRLAKELLQLEGSHIYISEKIKNKYNSYFRISGETIHVSCESQETPHYSPRKIENMVYFGNLGYGRYKTLITFARLMNKKQNKVKIHIYSNEGNDHILKKIKKVDNIVYHGSIPYKDIKGKAAEYDCLLLAEELSRKGIIKDVKYSLSTKVGDSLSFGIPIIAIGNIECGAIEFISKTKTGIVLSSKKDILNFSLNQINSNMIETMMTNATNILKEEFNKEKCCNVFRNTVDSVYSKKNNKNT